MPVLTDLVRQVLTNPHFHQDHRSTLKRVLFNAKLESQGIADVNDLIKEQVKLEAGAIFLLSVYRTLKFEAEADLDIEKSLVVLDTESKNAREAHALVVTNQEVASKRILVNNMVSLYEDIENIFRLVMARNRKLEHLSNNYRKEMAVDSHTD